MITTLMTLALLGVFVMQLYYIREAYNLKSQLFEQDVNDALNSVVTKVEKRFASLHINKKDSEIRRLRDNDFRDRAQQIVDYKENYKEEEAKRKMKQEKRMLADLNMRDSLVSLSYINPSIITEEDFQAISNVSNPSKTPLNLQLNLDLDVYGNIRATKIEGSIGRSSRSSRFTLAPKNWPDTFRYLAFNPVNHLPVTISLERVTADNGIKFKMEDQLAEQKYKKGLEELMSDTLVLEPNSLNYLEDIAKEMRQGGVPLNKRVYKDDLDTLIKRELQNRNISLNYAFWVKLANKDSLVYTKVGNGQAEILPTNTYKTTLFNNDIFLGDPGMLYVNFPNKNSVILQNMWVTMASSAGLLLVLIFIFSYTLYAIMRQKKISEMKTDFINNMTHEFKTPVSTIMIASEALKDPEIVEDKNRVSRLAGIIYDENVRLGNHIERVLSIARLEKKELKMECNEVNVNDLVAAVVDSMSLQLQKKNARIEMNLDALRPVIYGDELHISNVIYNLIDNANKYSADEPKISVSTRNTGKHLIVEVADQGIGMTKDQTKRIFDQFYRVPTGNLHDVKGFGLGLNYVQDIVAQMNGTIKVHSEKDKGTVFEISLPLNNK